MNFFDLGSACLTWNGVFCCFNGPWKEKQLTVISLNWHHSPFTGYSCSTIHHIVHSAHHTHVPKICIGLFKRSTMAQIRRHSGDHMNMTEPLRTLQNSRTLQNTRSATQFCRLVGLSDSEEGSHTLNSGSVEQSMQAMRHNFGIGHCVCVWGGFGRDSSIPQNLHWAS